MRRSGWEQGGDCRPESCEGAVIERVVRAERETGPGLAGGVLR